MSKLELLKCPGCGHLPEVHEWAFGCYCIQCARYDCDLPYTIMGGDLTSTIEAWNERANKYKGDPKNE